MSTRPVVSNVVFLPKSTVLDSAKLRASLTVSSPKFETDGSVTTEKFQAYKETSRGFIVPRRWGMDFLRHNNLLTAVKDMTVAPALPYEIDFTKSLREDQPAFVRSILKAFRTYKDVQATMRTGGGKTVCSLYVAAKLGLRTLVIIDQDSIRKQWIERIQEYWGIPEDEIGLIQGKTRDYENKPIVVGMMQTLYNIEPGRHISDSFGFVIVDECQTAGAPQYSRVMSLFNASRKLGVTATARTDYFAKVVNAHIGSPCVVSEEKHDLSQLRFVESYGVYSWYANVSRNDGRFITEISEDGRRNALLCTIIKWLYDRGHATLVLSDRVDHLENLRSFCSYLGIPDEHMGQCTGKHTIWAYVKESNPVFRPIEWDGKVPYTPVVLTRIEKKRSNKLNNAAQTQAMVVFATNARFGKAVDEPRLSAGVEATPRGKTIQSRGRVYRKMKGKKQSIWVTIRDVNSYKAEYKFLSRIAEYKKGNLEVMQWIDEKKIKRITLSALELAVRKRHEKLLEQRITTLKCGTHTVPIQRSEKRPSKEVACTTIVRRRSRKPGV